MPPWPSWIEQPRVCSLAPAVSHTVGLQLRTDKGTERTKEASVLQNHSCGQYGLSACCLLALERMTISEKKMATTLNSCYFLHSDCPVS